MKKAIIFFILSLIFSNIFFAQIIPQVLDKATRFRGFTKEDFTVPLDTTDQPNTNQCKLILPIVYNLMTNGSSSFDFMDRVMSYKDLELKNLILQLFKDINYYSEPVINSYSYSTDINSLGAMLVERIKLEHERENMLLGSFTPEEIEFLQKNIMTYFVSSDPNDSSMTDIYKLNQSQDSADAAAKRTLDILSKIDKDEVFSYSMDDFIFYYGLYKYLDENKNSFGSDKDIIYTYDKDGIRIAIGGNGHNFYTGKYDLIIDLGGDDEYKIDSPDKRGFVNNFNCIIDLSGNDLYSTVSDYSLAAGMFSSGFIFDKEGDDTYRAGNVSLGAGIGGLGLVYDESGNDIYEGTNFSIGAGLFGVGLLCDDSGNDFYIANTFSQGFGMTEGIGAILDRKGNDTYTISPTTVDINRYNDHYLSMCQGYGFGLRPYYAGGIGYIIEGEGNDVYACDIFGQAGSYWYSLGVIADYSGHDKYTGFHYNQGSGIHFSVGLLKDCEGWDYYSSNWVSQGCGHDYGIGILWDVKGNDLYACDGLSQGAGSANGIGILVDESGRDGYLSKDFNTQGYGQPLRNYGSIGIVADGSGNDFYSSSGSDSTSNLNSTWGIRLDDNAPELVQQNPSAEFKIEIDTAKSYSIDDLYLFARTLETRFSKFSQFGFDKMVQDSVNTANYMFTKAGSADIRDVVLYRNLNTKIGYSISNLLISKLNDYLQKKANFNNDELGFMCYLIGDAKNKAGKEVLLKMTYNDNYRVRSSAINALAKLDLKENNEFNRKAAERLAELEKEKSPKKIYNKDIAFGLSNFSDEKSIKALIDMMSYNYYGVRFAAAEGLKTNPEYYKYVIYALNSVDAGNTKWVQAFLYSLSNVPDENIEEPVNKLMKTDNDAVFACISALLNEKIKTTKDKDVLMWEKKVIRDIEAKLNIRNTKLR